MLDGKVITGVKQVRQFMDDGSMLAVSAGAMFRLLQSMGAPGYMDYDFIVSTSGAGARLTWQPGWAGWDEEPNQSTRLVNGDRLHEIRRGLAAAGIAYEACLLEDKRAWWEGGYTGDVTWVDVEKAEEDIRRSIDEGAPVLAMGVFGPPEASPLTGYSADGSQLYGVTQAVQGNEVDPETGYAHAGDWRGNLCAYFRVREFTPRAIDKQLIKETIANMVYLARLGRVDKLGDTALGLAAFDALAEHLVWDEGFEGLPVNGEYEGKLSWQADMPDGYYRTDGARCLSPRFWAGYCDFLCMLNGFDNVSRFLRRAKDVVPEWSDAIERAANYYFFSSEFSGDLWNYVTPDDAGVAKFGERDTRAIFGASMIKARQFAEKAVVILEGLLAGDC